MAFWYNWKIMMYKIETPEAQHLCRASHPCHLSWETGFCQPPKKQNSITCVKPELVCVCVCLIPKLSIMQLILLSNLFFLPR